jgi:hypothetical protein
MTQNNKPEWFKIVEADGPAAPVVAAPTSHLANPSIATLPTNGDDEHEEEDDD